MVFHFKYGKERTVCFPQWWQYFAFMHVDGEVMLNLPSSNVTKILANIKFSSFSQLILQAKWPKLVTGDKKKPEYF